MDKMAGKRKKFISLSWQSVGNMTAKIFSCKITTAFLSLIIAGKLIGDYRKSYSEIFHTSDTVGVFVQMAVKVKFMWISVRFF